MKKSVVLSLITHVGVLLDTLWQPRDSWPFTWILRNSVSLYGVLRPVKILQSQIVQVLKRIKKYSTWDFSGGPVVETPYASNARCMGLIPGGGTGELRSPHAASWPEKMQHLKQRWSRWHSSQFFFCSQSSCPSGVCTQSSSETTPPSNTSVNMFQGQMH